MIAPRPALPIHYDDCTVFKLPLDDLKAAVQASDLQTEVVYLDRGQSHRFGNAGRPGGD